MLGIDQKAARITWTVFLVGLLILVVYLARGTIIIFTLALFFAYMLAPVVDLVYRLVPQRVSRNLALAFVYVLFIGVLVGIGFGIGSAVADEASALSKSLPNLIQNNDPLGSVPLPAWLEPARVRIVEAIRSQLADLDQQAIPIIKKTAEEVLAHADILLTLVLVPILSFFFLKDGMRIKETVVRWTTDGGNTLVLDEILSDIHALLGHYIRALVLLACSTFVFYTLFLVVTGGQYAVLLGGIAGLLEFIPVVGPLAGALITLLVEGFSGYNHVVMLLIFIGCFRLFQDYVLSPYVMGSGVEMHPLLVLFGVLAGQQIAGIPGMFFSVPVIATLRVIYVRLERAQQTRDLTPRTG
jgi:predicted PurR-regulated permease PerM